MGCGVTRALCLDLFLSQGIQNPLHGRAVGSHLTAFQIGLRKLQLPQRMFGELVQHISMARAQGGDRVWREVSVDLLDQALPSCFGESCAILGLGPLEERHHIRGGLSHEAPLGIVLPRLILDVEAPLADIGA